jgi:predicted AlkP superfamily phosphohydrolase/phosphomutase
VPLQLLVLGLDGADWAILTPWLDAGHLPNLAGLRARGVWGPLRSTIRPESSIAWVTFATGVNAGRHGIYGFSGQQPDSYATTLNLTPAIRRPAFWQTAATMGKRMVVFNVPMTYPPEPLPGGAVVGGMLAPGLQSDFTSPAELRSQLLAAVPQYVLNVERTGLSLRQFIGETMQAIAARGAAARWLLARDRWDAAVIVFTDTDRLHHYTLHLLEPRHPRYDPAEAAALRPALLAAYQTLDREIGDLLALAGSDATVLVVSDHGFAPCTRRFYANTWLEQTGLLVRRPDAAAQPGLWRRLRASPTLRRLKRSLPVARDWQRPLPPRGHLSGVDWSQTAVAFSPAGGLRFNIGGREPEGFLSPDSAERLAAELIPALLDLVDPATGHHPIQAVHRRDDLYQGPYVELAPDLILESVRSDADPMRNTAVAFGFAPAGAPPGPFTSSGDLTGNHALDGMLIAAGPGIQHGHIAGAQLLDLAPTLLHALALPVSRDLEGRVLSLWSEPRPIDWVDGDLGSTSPASAATGFTPDEQATVEERLRALGYL